MFTGVIGMGIFLSLLLKVNYGTDTCAFMNHSLSDRFQISLGTTMILTNLIFLIPELILGRDLIGIGTIANMVMVGYVCDFCELLEERFLPDYIFEISPFRPFIFVVSLLLFLISAALYMNSEMGQVPYDSIPTILSRKVPIPFFAVRMIWDFFIIGAAVAAGGTLTFTTVVLALTMGPAVTTVGRLLEHSQGGMIKHAKTDCRSSYAYTGQRARLRNHP